MAGRVLLAGYHRYKHEETRTTRTPSFRGYPLWPHDYPYYWAIHIRSEAHTIEQFILDPKPILLSSSYSIPSPYYWAVHIGSQVKTRQSQRYKFYKFVKTSNFLIKKTTKKLYIRHIFLGSLIRWVNMKWIQQVLYKIQSGRDSIHRWTEGQGETSIPHFNFIEWVV